MRRQLFLLGGPVAGTIGFAFLVRGIVQVLHLGYWPSTALTLRLPPFWVAGVVCLILGLSIGLDRRNPWSTWSLISVGLLSGGVSANFMELEIAGSITDFIPIGNNYLSIGDVAMALGISLSMWRLLRWLARRPNH